jgi:uncharacterized protein YneF (UPF0154 family)
MQNAGVLIPIMGILCGIIAIIGGYVVKLKKMEIERQQLSSSGDISSELQNAIKGEFTRLRQENEDLRRRVETLERGSANGQQLSQAQLDEIAKQVALRNRA